MPGTDPFGGMRPDPPGRSLRRLPHRAVDALLDRLHQPQATRALTVGERARALEAFGRHALPLVAGVRISNGAGRNPVARIAFRNGNPAIALGRTIFFRAASWRVDFAASAAGLPAFLHEVVHVIQWERMGYAAFLRRYLRELRACGGATGMYDYPSRSTTFCEETLEGQAQMAEDYARLLFGSPGAGRAAPDLARRLAGSGVYGL